jgi:nitrite reductase/ring-hydroxylating ferredoxin subunit
MPFAAPWCRGTQGQNASNAVASCPVGRLAPELLMVSAMDDELIDLDELLRGQCGSTRRAFCLGAGAGLAVLAAACEAPNPRLETGGLDNQPGGLGGTTGGGTTGGGTTGGGTTGGGTTGGGTTGGGTTGGGTTGGGTTGGGTTGGNPVSCDSSFVAAGLASDVLVGKAKRIRGTNLDAWLCHDANGWYAMDNYCPHRGCTVSFRTKGDFYCGCHGATFDFNGKQTNFVSSRPMDHLAMCIDSGGNAFIDPNNAVSASQRY